MPRARISSSSVGARATRLAAPVGVGGPDDACGARPGGRRRGGCRAACAAPARGRRAAAARRRRPGGRPASGAGGGRDESVGEGAGRADARRRARMSKRVAGLAVADQRARARGPRRSRAIRSTRRWLATVGPGALGVEDVLQHQARVVGLAVDVDLRARQAGRCAGAGESARARARTGGGCRAADARARARCRARCRRPACQAGALAAVAREDELDRPAEVGRRRHQAARSAQPLEDERRSPYCR